MVARAVAEWLLDPGQPAARYRALRLIEGRGPRDPAVRAARRDLPARGWVEDILARRDPGGWWVRPDRLYTPKYLSTNWQLIVLAELGMTRAHPAIRRSCELWMERSPLRGGGVGGFSNGHGHLCYTGNMVRALVQFGYADDLRVRKALDWLVATAHPKGGWSCWTYGDGPARGRNLDSWEALGAFAVYPRSRWSDAMAECVRRGAEFFLSRGLIRQGGRYAPWLRTHYPVHYYYDRMVGLDLLTALGYGDDPRLAPSIRWLKGKRRADGRWNLDAQHPDAGGAYGRWIRQHPAQAPRPMILEAEGRPSKLVTLRALEILQRVEARSVGRSAPGA